MTYKIWLASSLVRQFPLSKPGRARVYKVQALRGQRLSFQVCMQLMAPDTAEVALSAKAPAGVNVEIRRVGYVPVPHHNTVTSDQERDGVGFIPGYVPDVLFPESTGCAVRGEVLSFWITVTVDCEIKAGTKKIELTLALPGGEKAKLQAVIEVLPIELQPRRDFRVTHWFYTDTIAEFYKVAPFTDAFWPICEKYMRNYAAHGNDTIYVPVFTPPLDGLKKPTQLLHITKLTDGYTFDWSAVERWIQMAQGCGITHFEWVHLFSQWGVKNALRIYEGRGEDESKLLWPVDTAATDPVYRKFLAQFLSELKTFLDKHQLLERSLFHLSDEPSAEHLPNYKAARQILRELAPWMKVFDALSHIEFAKEGLADMPVATISHAKEFANAGIEHWAYFCCWPRGEYLNRLLDTPLPKIRMAGWLFYRFGAKGFLHWGYNFWLRRHTRNLVDPFTVNDAGAWPEWPYGDAFMVYPGPDGPIDSLRWEVFAESLQDYAILQTLGVDPHGKLLAELKDYGEFPKSEAWITRTMKKAVAKKR